MAVSLAAMARRARTSLALAGVESKERTWLSPAASALQGEASAEAKAASERIEALRHALAAREGGVEIYYSPKPGSHDAASGERPEHGEIKTFSYAQAARTGISPTWGQCFFSVVRARQPKFMLELGACAGISGSYLAAGAPDAEFHTIEASRELADIARGHIRQFTRNAVVHNALFDDALDDILAEEPRIDFAYIDGHHEKEATLHYYRRIAPNLAEDALVVFDDIRWSADMWNMWETAAALPDIALAVDMGKLGLATRHKAAAAPRQIDLAHLSGRKINEPHGWQGAA